MLAEWYFCSANRLSPLATHIFLDIVSALRRTDQGARELVGEALRQLGHAERAQQLYCLPHVLAARRTFAEDRTIQTLVAELLREVAGATEWRGLAKAVRPAGDTVGISDRVRQIARAVGVGQDRACSDRPYLDRPPGFVTQPAEHHAACARILHQ